MQGRYREITRLICCYGTAQVDAKDPHPNPTPSANQVDAKDWDGTTALHAASQAGHAAAVLALLSHGARANVGDNYDDRPLHAALAEVRPRPIPTPKPKPKPKP